MLWRMQLLPEGAQAGVDPFSFCVQKRIVGCGWPVPTRPHDAADYLTQGEQKYGTPSWRKASNALLKRMRAGHLVWIRSPLGRYWLGRTEGDWAYSDSPEHLAADIVNFRSCPDLFEVGSVVPGKIANSFIPGATVQAIDDPTAQLFSKLLFNQLSGRVQYPVTAGASNRDPFSLLTSEALEDLVALYLQVERDYCMVPSSRTPTNNTPAFEFELRHRVTGQPALVQVKSGNVQLSPANHAVSGTLVFLFSPAGYIGPVPPGAAVETLARQDVERFFWSSGNLFPPNIAVWRNWLLSLGGSAAPTP